jgi:ABC-type transporter Mla subunit MlaD
VNRRLRDLVDPIPATRREHPLAAGAIVLALLALFVYSCITHSIPLVSHDAGRIVRAEFKSANFVDNQTPVRVGGVDVGHVSAVHLNADRGRALVTMRITNPHLVVKRDALATIRWRTLLGGTFYIDLDPGSPSAASLADSVIPASHTAAQVEFDDLNQVFAGRTAHGPRVFLRETRQALADRGVVGAALRSLSTSTPTIAAGVAPLRGRRSDDLRRLVAATGTTTAALARDTVALQRLVTRMDGTFAVTAAERRALGRLIELSPGALDSTAQTMRRLDVTLGHLDPLVAALRPGARALGPATSAATPALGALRALLGDARPLLGSLRPSLASLARAGRQGTPLMRGLMPTLARMRTELDPWLARRDPSTGMRTYEALGPAFGAIDSGAGELDGEGYWLHFPTQTDTRSIAVGLPGGTGVASLRSLCRTRSVDHGRCDSVIAALGHILGSGR